MADFLLELSKNPQARGLVKSLGLPIPMPQSLRRARGARTDRPLADKDVGLCVPSGSALTSVLAETLTRAGANPHVIEEKTVLDSFKGPGEAFGRGAEPLELDGEGRYHALVMDATGVDSPAALRKLYDFFHPLIRGLRPNGRALVIGRRPETQNTPEAAAAQAALDGFVRSLAKETGKKGSAALLLTVDDGAEEWIAGPLTFLLSERSAYVSGQPLHVGGGSAPNPAAQSVCPLEGKVALVTGAARGIGKETARLLAAEGATVICLDRPDDDGPTSKLARELEGAMLLCDVTSEDAPETIANFCKERFGGVDIVVHNAGVTRDKTLRNMKPHLWDLTMDVNLGAVIRITNELVSSGALRDNGRLVLLSSIAGIAGNMGQTNYAASKAGVIGLCHHLAGSLQRGITCNAIAPGFIETRLTDAIPFAIREVARRMNNLGQGGRPQDVGETVTFFALPSSQGVSGQVLRVCGGSLVGR